MFNKKKKTPTRTHRLQQPADSAPSEVRLALRPIEALEEFAEASPSLDRSTGTWDAWLQSVGKLLGRFGGRRYFFGFPTV